MTTFSGNETEEVTAFREPKPTKKGQQRKTITWTTERPPTVGKQRACDVIDTGRKRDRLPGTPHGEGKNVKSIGDAFDLMYTRDMYELRTRSINGKVQAIIDLIPAERLKLAKYRHIRLTDPTGIYIHQIKDSAFMFSDSAPMFEKVCPQ